MKSAIHQPGAPARHSMQVQSRTRIAPRAALSPSPLTQWSRCGIRNTPRRRRCQEIEDLKLAWRVETVELGGATVDAVYEVICCGDSSSNEPCTGALALT